MKRQFLLSSIITFVFLTTGFLLLHYQLIGYGLSIFVFLPFVLGYVLADGVAKKFSLIGFLFSLVVFFILLLTGGLEGMVCIIMALPLVIVATALGYFIKNIIDKKNKQNRKKDFLKSSLIPLLLFIGLAFGEKELTKNDKQIISVTTEMIFPYSTMQVYETIKSVDTMIAEKPFLMKLDLPIPNKCILQKEAVGGLRICYFSGGTITERITELEKAKVLKMDVIDYKLTGRKWLGFKEAIYYFEKAGPNSCKLTRITTYTSVLQPRFYWQPLEETGISQEHDYVFANLLNDLRKKYGKK